MTTFFKNVPKLLPIKNVKHMLIVPNRPSSYYGSPKISEVGKVDVKYTITSLPEDWKYVERLLPPEVVPLPTPKEKYLSGWTPPSEECLNQPYFVERTKNHMMPVYLEIAQHGIRRVTKVRNIKGDIWALEGDIRAFLQKETIKIIRSQVNEFAGYIRIYGDHVNAIKYWLEKKKF